MAHGDYACCFICDRKCYYDPHADAKDDLCTDCCSNVALHFQKPVTYPAKFLEETEGYDKDQLKALLDKLGYKACFYGNDFDLAITERLSKPEVKE